MSATYVELSAGGLMAATGYYQMAPDQLEKYRTALLSEGGNIYGAELRSLFADVGRAGCTVGGELLKTAPRGVSRTAENIDLLRYKSVTVSATLRINGGETLAQAETFVAKTWHVGQPVSNWLDQHVGASTLAP